MAIKVSSPTGIDINDTGLGYTLSLINGKYKMIIMYWLAEFKPVMGYNELKRCIGTVSHKTLSTALKKMEADRSLLHLRLQFTIF